MPQAIDVFNKFLVSSSGDDVVFLSPVPRRLTHAEALLLAAYIVAIAVPRDGEPSFDEVLKAVLNA